MTYWIGMIKTYHEFTEKYRPLRWSNAQKSFAYSEKTVARNISKILHMAVKQSLKNPVILRIFAFS
eukprot:UN18803